MTRCPELFVGDQVAVDRAADAYRRQGDFVMQDDDTGGQRRVRVTTRDGRAEIVLEVDNDGDAGGRARMEGRAP